MALKDFIENNPWITLLSVGITFAGISAGAAGWFFGQKLSIVEANNNLKIETLTTRYESKVEELERRINSINRGLKVEEKLFDVRTLFVADDMPIEGTRKQEPFEDGRFYAVMDKDSWAYELTTETSVIRSFIPESKQADFDLAMQMSGIGEFANRFPVHVWRHKNKYTIEENEDFGQICGLVSVQRVAIDEFERQFPLLMQESKQQGLSELNRIIQDINTDVAQEVAASTDGVGDEQLSEDERELLARLGGQFRGDAVGFFLQSFFALTLQINAISTSTVFSLVNVQKVRNVAYVSGLMNLVKPKVNGRKVNSFLIKREMIIASTENELFVITALTPTFDIRVKSDEATSIASWLDDLRIVARL